MPGFPTAAAPTIGGPSPCCGKARFIPHWTRCDSRWKTPPPDLVGVFAGAHPRHQLQELLGVWKCHPPPFGLLSDSADDGPAVRRTVFPGIAGLVDVRPGCLDSARRVNRILLVDWIGKSGVTVLPHSLGGIGIAATMYPLLHRMKWARRDSNARPLAPEASALSN